MLEIQENQSVLDSNLIANEQKREQMQATKDSLLAQGEEVNISVSIGYNQVIMSNGAWEMAKLSGAIRRFEPRTIQNLSEMYYLQEMYMNLGNEYFAQLASASFHQNKEELPRIDASLNLIKITESIGKAMMASYSAFLEDHADIAARLEAEGSD